MKTIYSVLKFWFTYLVVFRANKIKYLRSIGVKIGQRCSILNNINQFSDPWLIEIGNDVTLTPGVLLVTHDGANRLFRREEKGFNPVFGNIFNTIIIKDNSFIGVNTIILPGVTIGPNSIVGAGSVVTHDVLPDMVYAGNPAKPMCTLEEFKAGCKRKMIPVNSIDRKSLRKELSIYFWNEER